LLALRADKEGTWISSDIKNAYIELHQLGYAHSIEIWLDDKLAGGFLWCRDGEVFFLANPCFHCNPNASKIALKTFLQTRKRLPHRTH